MKKGERLPRLIKTNTYVTECQCSRRSVKEVFVTQKRYISLDEGSNKWGGEQMFIGFCNRCGNAYLSSREKVNLEGDFRLIRVD